MNPSGLSSLTPPQTPSIKRRKTFVWTPIFPENLVTPCMRSKHASCVVNNFIYIFGGRDAHGSKKDLWKYNITSNVWTRLDCFGTAPPLLQDHTMVYRDSKLYIFGGELGFGTCDETPLWNYDLIDRSWEKEVGGSDVKQPIGRRGHTATIANDVMYVYGGYLDLKGSSSELWLYDFESNSWHIDMLSKLHEPAGRHNHSAVLHNNAIWIYGGLSNLFPKADLWKWEIDTRKWSRVRFHQGPCSLNGHSACAHNDSMFIFGGEDGSTTPRNDLWIFNFVTFTWSKVTPYQGILPSPSLHHSLLPILTEVQLNSHSHVQYRTASVPHLQPHLPRNIASPQRPYSSPPDIDRSLSSHHPELSKFFQNRIFPQTNGLLSPTAAEHTLCNEPAEQTNGVSDNMFYKRRLFDDVEQKDSIQPNMLVRYEQADADKEKCEDCRHCILNKDLVEPCRNCGVINIGADETQLDSHNLFDEKSKTQPEQDILLVDLEHDIDYINFTEQTKLLTLQKHSKIYQADEPNGFYNNGYIDGHLNSNQPNDIHKNIYANSKTRTFIDNEHKVNQKKMLIPKIVEPGKQRHYERSNTVDAQKNAKDNVHMQWYLARDNRGYCSNKPKNETILCMYLIGGKEGGGSSGIKTPLSMWKCGIIPGKPSSQEIRKMMSDLIA